METKLDPMNRYRFVEDNADLLFTAFRSAPARAIG
jgi:hypothetical protein